MVFNGNLPMKVWPWILGGFVLYAAGWGVKRVQIDKLHLKHFRPEEFGTSLPFLDSRLLIGLDAFREALGKPVMISPASGSLYRPWQPSSVHSRGQAADVMLPQGPDLRTAYAVARGVGIFSGIGVYPDWIPWPGLHLDVRTTRSPMDPALWAGILVNNNQEYVGIDQGFRA